MWAQMEKSQAMYCFTEENKISKVENVKRIGAVRSGGRSFVSNVSLCFQKT